MLEDEKKQDISITGGDEALLLVSGSKGSKDGDKDYVKKLANAIVQVYNKHDEVRLRSVGAAANNHFVKAYAIAKKELLKQGHKFHPDWDFTTVQFDGEDKTGILFEILPD